MTASKNPKLRFKDENGIDFPDWENLKIGDIGDLKTSSVDKLSKEGEKEVYLLNYMDVYKRDHIYKTDKFQKITAKDTQIVENNLLKGDILFTPSSETPTDIGHSAVVVEDLDGVLYSYHLMRLRPKSNILNIKFSGYAFKTFNFYKELWKRAQGATRYTLSISSVKEANIKIPKSIDEQEKISEFLTTVDNYIQNLKSQKEELEKYKKGMMQKIFSQQLRFKDSNGKDFPEWKKHHLFEVAKIEKGVQLNRASLDINENELNYPSINGGITPSGFSEKFNSEPNTITISEGGNSCGYINLIKKKFWCGGHCYKLTIKDNSYYLYIFYYLKFIENKIMKLRVGSGLPNIQKKDLEKIKIPLPKIEEQIEISCFLQNVDNLIENSDKEILLAEQWKKGLMQQMFI